MRTYTIFEHHTLPDGRIETRVTDNDDDDDGWPDDEIACYTLPAQPKERALRSPMDVSHIGCAGREVTVRLDGIELKEQQ